MEIEGKLTASEGMTPLIRVIANGRYYDRDAIAALPAQIRK